MSKNKLKYEYIPAKSISYGSARSLATIKYIVIHYTGNKGDTARGNGLYFKNSNTRQAGAHWFVDQGGNIVLSIPMDKTAWSVGGFFTKDNGAGQYYQICVNANSVSIELCNLVSGEPSQAMKDAVRDLVAYIQSQCPNAKTIIRHYDVNGKSCLPVDSTELLTPNGWVSLDEVNIGDEVCTYNTETDTLSFDHVQDVIEPYMADTIKNRNFEATRDHRMWVKRNGKKYKFHEWTYGDLLDKKTGFIVKNSGKFKQEEELPLTDDEVRLLVWIQGDGYYIRNKAKDKIYGVEFHLKKERKITRIKTLLDDLSISYKEFWCKNGSVHIRIYDTALIDWAEQWLDNKVFTYKLLSMSQEQYDVFYDECLVVDGCKSVRHESYTSAIQQNLDVVQALAATHEQRTCLVKLGTEQNMGVQFAKCNYTIGEGRGTVPSTQRNTLVSCVTVPSGYILIRQNNRTFIVGNCPATMIGKNNKSWEKFKAYISNKEPEGIKTTVIKNGILYNKNDSKSKQIMKVAKGDIWYIQSDNGEGWSYVTDGINTGYVKNKLLADGSLSKFPVKSLIENAALFADNNRECPIGSIVKGEVVEIISHRSVWTEVIYDGQKGWVKTAKINFD